MTDAPSMASPTLAQVEDAYRRVKDLYDKGTLPEIRMVEMESALTKARAAEAISRRNVDEIVLRGLPAGRLDHSDAPPLAFGHVLLIQTRKSWAAPSFGIQG